MKLVFSFFALAGIVSGLCPTSFNVIGRCDYATVSEAADCDLQAELGLNETGAEELVEAICDEAVEGNTRNFTYVTYQGGNSKNFQWDNNYFDGGTDWNDAQETETEVLHSGDSGSILRTFNDFASDAIISWPDYGPNSHYTDNFKNCDARVAMCCYIDNRLDIPLNPNADICYHDLQDSKHSNHINRGYAVFHEREEKAYCNAISWEADEDEVSARYAGNALFYMSLYTGLYEKGYVGNIASSPLCACIEQMATVDYTDCTKVDADETYSFTLNGTDLSATLSSDVTYSACDTDFISHYTSMSTVEEAEELQSKHIVDECTDVIDDFMNNKYYVPGSLPTFVNSTDWATAVGQGVMYSPPISDSDLRELLAESPNSIIWRKCLWCSDSHKEIYYKRITELPPAEELDFLDLLMNNWYDAPGNKLGVDFKLFSAYNDALEGTGNWTFCNYNDEAVGFPRDCGPTGQVSYNWNSYVKDNWRTRQSAFYVEKSLVSQS